MGEEQYQSLYRRYRPQRFADVRGQDQVTKPLRNAVREGRVAHAYLFSGPRGTGKTSTARILAMALNCEHPQDGEPDGTCPSCVDIRRGASMDVHELDAASNRRLDEMRDLLSRVALGTRGAWKVYIIDEVHQLTPDASSALLKTLEEPPAHVVFVLATTDPQKVLPTIRSRTQHFEFRLLPADVLSGLVADVTRQAALEVGPDAIDMVVRRGHGSARDALSALDQVATAGVVEDETALVAGVVDALAERDAGRVLTAVAEAMAAGRDARRLATDLLEHLRNGFLATQAPALVLLPEAEVGGVADQAGRLGLPALVRAMETVGQALVDMRDSVDTRVTLDAALIRLVHPEADHSPAAILERLDRLERRIASGGAPARGPDPGAPAQGQRGAAPSAPGVGGRPAESPAASAAPGTQPPTGPAGARAALGAHRRPLAGPAAHPGPAPTGSPAAASPPSSAVTNPPGATAPSPVPPASPAPPVTNLPTAPSPAGAGSSPAPPAPTQQAPMPTRDDLTTAWGDVILPSLRPMVRAYMARGRFLAVEGEMAVFALPERPLLSRAEQVKPEAESVLTAHFGRRVRLRLVHDAGAPPPPSQEGGGAPGAAPGEDPSGYDLTDLSDAGAGPLTPEQRLLQAFPGAQEVNP